MNISQSCCQIWDMRLWKWSELCWLSWSAQHRSYTSIFLFSRLCCPDFPWCHKDWQIQVLPEARHPAAHDVHRRLPEGHAGGHGGPCRSPDHEDLQHQCHELHSWGAGPGGAEVCPWAPDDLQCGSSQASHRLVSSLAAGKKKHHQGWNKVSFLFRNWQIGPVQFKSYGSKFSLVMMKHLKVQGDFFLSLTFLGSFSFFFPCSWQLAHELRRQQRPQGLGLETRLWPPWAGDHHV